MVRNGKGRVNRLNLNDFSGLWSIGTAPSSLVAGLGVIRVHDTVGLLKPLPFFRGSEMETGGQEILSVLGDRFEAKTPQELKASSSHWG